VLEARKEERRGDEVWRTQCGKWGRWRDGGKSGNGDREDEGRVDQGAKKCSRGEEGPRGGHGGEGRKGKTQKRRRCGRRHTIDHVIRHCSSRGLCFPYQRSRRIIVGGNEVERSIAVLVFYPGEVI
jgi:hypothetical protein